EIANLLARADLNVPQIHGADLEQGFLLLSDLGRQTYLDVIDSDNADQLFEPAIDALLAYQQLPMDAGLPHYDDALLRRELQLFPDWYVARELGLSLDAEQQAAWQRICTLL
ncbi:MAG: phosphotransferase, partial [Xanthomonas perforans]|nr:phosphotransferase [Xanthomonas perforans]